MLYEKLDVHIRGLTPTIMNNAQMVDPMNKWAVELKKMTSIKANQRTEENTVEMQRIEWMGHIYLDDKMCPCWPGDNIEAMLRAAARLAKEGKSVERGVLVESSAPVIFDGPSDLEEMFLDERFRLTCRVCQNKKSIMRTRPIFREWELKFQVSFLPEKADPTKIKRWLEVASTDICLSDWRPKHGKFEIISTSE